MWLNPFSSSEEAVPKMSSRPLLKKGVSENCPNSETRPLWKVHGKYYDLTKFIPRHPGGQRVLRQTVGKDISALVESHHLTEKPFLVMKKYLVTSEDNLEEKVCYNKSYYNNRGKKVYFLLLFAYLCELL